VIRGTLGADMEVEAGAQAARACALALLAQARAACEGDWDRLLRVVKLTASWPPRPASSTSPASSTAPPS
jgi:hypothetical protein